MVCSIYRVEPGAGTCVTNTSAQQYLHSQSCKRTSESVQACNRTRSESQSRVLMRNLCLFALQARRKCSKGLSDFVTTDIGIKAADRTPLNAGITIYCRTKEIWEISDELMKKKAPQLPQNDARSIILSLS